MREIKFRVWNSFQSRYKALQRSALDSEVYPYGNNLKTGREITIEQYTGLTDKNGVEIYEGDLLGHKNNVVEFSGGCFNINGDRTLDLMNGYEVIGNIHEGVKGETT